MLIWKQNGLQNSRWPPNVTHLITNYCNSYFERKAILKFCILKYSFVGLQTNNACLNKVSHEADKIKHCHQKYMYMSIWNSAFFCVNIEKVKMVQFNSNLERCLFK